MSEIKTGSYNAFPFSSFIPFYVNGLLLSNDATTPLTILDVGVGSIVDSTGTYQMETTAALSISTAFNGVGGLDTGAIAASTVYFVYLVSDPVTNNPIGGMLSLAAPSVGPLMPYGYSAFALLGYVAIDSSSHILKGYWTAEDSAWRTFTYDAFQATLVTAGSSATYANVKLNGLVPNVNNTPVQVYTSFAAGAAGDVLSLQAGNATGAQATLTAQVTTTPLTTISTVLAQPVTITSVSYPVINYKVSGTDTVAIDVAGYSFRL